MQREVQLLNSTLVIIDDGIGSNITGIDFPVKQLFHDYNFLTDLYLDIEKHFNCRIVFNYMNNNNLMCWSGALVFLYFLFVLLFPKVMKSRKPFNWLKKPLIVWNLLLAVFSFIGAVRVIPHLINTISKYSLYTSICGEAEYYYGHGAAGLWLFLFVLSKIPELGDTVFLVLRKRDVIFLHWYHHVTVLLFCVHSYLTRATVGFYFAAMNYAVHSIMYFYYFLTAVGYRPPWDKLVTFAQISQMFFGVSLNILVYYYYNTRGCPVNLTNFYASILMYLSYFVLFVLFAIERYCHVKFPWNTLAIKTKKE